MITWGKQVDEGDFKSCNKYENFKRTGMSLYLDETHSNIMRTLP